MSQLELLLLLAGCMIAAATAVQAVFVGLAYDIGRGSPASSARSGDHGARRMFALAAIPDAAGAGCRRLDVGTLLVSIGAFRA